MANNYILNQEVFNQAVEEYRKELPNTRPNEIFKWQAVQWFQDHWDIDAENFQQMLLTALEKTASLLAARHFFALEMISLFAEKEPELVRNMFKELFDESLSLLDRAINFESNAKEILKKHFPDLNNDYQNFNTISTYLWLKYPDKYYIYKSGDYRAIASQLFDLGKDHLPIGIKKRYEELIQCIELYDVLKEALNKDTELIQISDTYLVDGCYLDKFHHILTVDFVFFITQQTKVNTNAKTYLFSWNPNNWPWDSFNENRLECLQNDAVTHRWTCASHKKIKIGDRFFMVRLGNEPRGVFASGTVISDAYEEDHWNESGKLAKYVDLEFDTILDPTEINLSIPILDNMVSQITPQKKFNWTPQGSGIEIPKEYVQTLINLWSQDQSDDINKNAIFHNTTNQILYGPPGTGKTYKTQKIAEDYVDTVFDEKRYLMNTVENLPWFNVFIFALLDIGKACKVGDILSNRFYLSKLGLKKPNWGHVNNELVSRTIPTPTNVNYDNDGSFKRKEPRVLDRNNDNEWRIVDSEKEKISDLIEEFKQITGTLNQSSTGIIGQKNRYEIVTFHQSFSYEDFVEGIRASTNENGQIQYSIEDGIFKRICDKARKEPSKKFAIFIDEINRGNIANIFGELITLIEPDKRQGCKNELSITLPYSKELFSVPNNLDIYGTMNTSDHSLTKLDLALRRRFEFVELLPDYSLINDIKVYGINIGEILETINDRIEILLGRDYLIGHSYFLELRDLTEDKKIEKLASIFQNKIIPLLQEYFFEDWERIQWVLNDQNKEQAYQFIHLLSETRKNDLSRLFGNLQNMNQVPDRRYQINEDAFKKAEAYSQILVE